MSNNRPTPNPGSDEALELGCLCPVLDNSRGKGYFMQSGVFVFNSECPLHRQPKGSNTIDETEENQP